MSGGLKFRSHNMLTSPFSLEYNYFSQQLCVIVHNSTYRGGGTSVAFCCEEKRPAHED